ncbi:MAG: glucosamine-6-phosphate deaminase [Firmicutes bacterium]|nr:glucosamine-6-phosphate deaminase [Candidatus Colimorpha enterica]
MAVLKDFYCDKMRTRVFSTRGEMGVCAGTEIANKIKEFLAKKEYVNVMFAAAPSQNETLQALMADPDIEWNRINAFHMDEYVGLDEDHPAGFRNFLRRSVFDLKDFRSVNLLNGNAADPEKEAERYSALLRDNPLDVCILGIGENGHVAFNDPPVADFNDAKLVKIVELEQRCRQQQVNDGCFDVIDKVPTHALTVTVPGLCTAEWMFCSVPAATKAEAVYRVVNGEISTKCPATILRTKDHAFLYADADSGKNIL